MVLVHICVCLCVCDCVYVCQVIVPIHKKGCHTVCDNYCGIALLSVPMQQAKAILTRIKPRVECLLRENQCGLELRMHRPAVHPAYSDGEVVRLSATFLCVLYPFIVEDMIAQSPLYCGSYFFCHFKERIKCLLAQLPI